MTGKDLKHYLLSAAFVVPTSTLDGWKQLKFNKISQNKVSITNEKKIKIEVNESASPLIFKLPEIKKVSEISVSISTNGELEKLNTSKFPDDSIFRLGLVAKGEQRLGWFQKKIAANWVLELFSLAPDSIGLDKIYFFNFATTKNLIGEKRLHPKSDLMHEEIVASYPETKDLTYKLHKSLEVVALWISVDGDDTKANFNTTIEKLELQQIQ